MRGQLRLLGYSLIRHMKAMVSRGDIGGVRMVFSEFAHGHHADATDADNPRIRWRYDPAQIGVSANLQLWDPRPTPSHIHNRPARAECLSRYCEPRLRSTARG